MAIVMATALKAPDVFDVPDMDVAVQRAVDGIDDTAFALYRRLSAVPGTGNVVFSPFGLSSALGLAATGARGETQSQLARLVGLGDTPESIGPALRELVAGVRLGSGESCDLNVANRLWVQTGLLPKPGFRANAERDFGAMPGMVDFANAAEPARLDVNAWVKAQTEGEVTDLLGPSDVDGNTRLVLTSAVTFRGSWDIPFQQSSTVVSRFHTGVIGGGTEVVPLMTTRGDFRCAEIGDLQVMQLPYEGSRLSMLVILPQRADGMARVEASLSNARISEWVGQLETQDAIVQLPRFKVDTAVSLNNALRQLGVTVPFNDQADFSGIANDAGPLKISKVVHQTAFSVDESGTRATSGTGVVIRGRSMPFLFEADHPFVFLVRDDTTGLVLFLGRFVHP